MRYAPSAIAFRGKLEAPRRLERCSRPASRCRLPASLAAALFILAAGPRDHAAGANGDVLSISSVLAGKDLSTITLDISNNPPGGSFWAAGRLTGKIHHLTLDLATVLGEIPNPHGVGSIPNFILTWGLAYRPLTRTLFVLAQEGPTWKVKEVRTDGTEVPTGAFTITPPNAATASLRGLTFDSVTSQLWYLDANNDLAVLTDLEGRAVRTVSLPGDIPIETTLRGDGICYRLEKAANEIFEPRLYVTYGDIFAASPSRIIQLDPATGKSTGVEVPLMASLPGPLGFQVYQLGLNQRRIALVLEDGRIAQIEQVFASPSPPSQLKCALTLTNQVALTWQNNGAGANGAYGGQISILRNGVPFTRVTGSTTQFTDATPLEGTAAYALRAANVPDGPTSPDSHPCEVTVGTGGIVRWVPFPGALPYDITRNPANGEVYVTDNVGTAGQGRILRFNSRLEPAGEIPSPWTRPGPIAFVPLLEIQDVELRDVLAVGRTDGPLLRIMDLAGTERTTFTLETRVSAPVIGGLTYIQGADEFALLEDTTHKIIFVDPNGRYRRECVPPPLLGLDPLALGLTHDPIQETFLAVFSDGIVRELYAGGNCVPTQFEIPLGSLGQGFEKPSFSGGVEIAGNTLLVCGRESRALFQVLIFPAGPPFVRGDFDRSGIVNLTDAVSLARYLFQSGSAPTCQDAADVNDDGVLDVSDPVYLLFYLFLEGAPPPAPFPGAGSDPTFRDNLGCEA
ncbi:MAG TPA: dockerin type I repeat-containing protein [Planctomycetota bacterium]|nr:dockerin type I repeat-containing protein [Planctomycetota bacterium]